MVPISELGTGYISIIPETSKITPGIKKALGDSSVVYDQAGASGGKSFGQKFSSAATGLLKKGGLAAGAAGGAAVATGITKGLGRLNSIEQAEAKLKGLGNSTQQVGSIMENALASVSGTAFGLEEAAATAGSLVAAGIKPGQELEGVLTTVADSATIAGRSMSDMGLIFGSVAAKGKLQGDDMLQLLAGGIPVLQLLAEETGKTSAEISDMVSAGEVDFALFERAMKRGMGGAALEAGNTVQGAFKNMGAALGRLGATISGPFFDQAAGGFTGVTNALDDMNAKAKPVMEEFSGWMTSKGIPAVKQFATEAVASLQSLGQSDGVQSAIQGTVYAFDQLVAAGRALAPALGQIGASLSQAAAATGVGAWKIFVSTLTAAGAVAEALAGPLQTVADLMQAHPGMVTAAVAAWAGFKTIPGLFGGVASGIAKVTGATKQLEGVSNPIKKIGLALSPIKENAVLVGSSLKDAGANAKQFAKAHPEVSKLSIAMQTMGAQSPAIKRIGDAYTSASSGLKTYAAQQKIASAQAQVAAASSKNLFTTVDRMGVSAFRSASGSVASFAGTLKGVGSAGFTAMRGAAKGVIDMLGGPWGAALIAAGGAAMFVADSLQKMKEQQRLSAELAKTGEVAYRDMFDTLVDGGDKIESSTKQVSKLRENLSDLGKTDHGGVFRFIDEMGVKFNSLKGIVDPLSKAQAEQVKNQLDTADSAEKAAAKLDELGMSDEDVARKVNASTGEFAGFTAKLRESGEGGKELANHLEEIRLANEKAQESFEKLGPQAANAAKVIEDLGGKAQTSADDVMALHDAIYGLGDGADDAGEAAGKLTEEIDKAANSAKDFGEVTLDASGHIDQTTTSGREFYKSLKEVADGYVGSVAASNSARDEWLRVKDTFYALGEGAGFSQEQTDELLRTMGYMPDQVKTTVEVAGDTAKSELLEIGQQLSDFDGSGPFTADVKVSDKEARDAIENAGFKLSEFDESTGMAKLEVADEDAAARFEWWTTHGFPEFDAANPTAIANMDTQNLEFSAEYARMTIDTIDKSRPISLAGMDTSQLTAAQVEALQRIGVLDAQTAQPIGTLDLSQFSDYEQVMIAKILDLSGQTARPAATLVTDALDQGTDKSKDRVSDLDKQKAEPKVDLDPKPVIDGANRANQAIASITPRKDVDVVFNASYAGDWDRANQSRRATGGYWRGPSYASGGRHGGYQLPTTGPGTDMTDGFLAFDRNNVPAARLDAGEWIINRGSSEKYDRELAQINAGTFPKLPGYEDGGRHGAVKHADEIIKFAKGLQGKPYVRGGVNWGDCSGAMSAIARFAVGMDPFAGRFATGNQREALMAMGFTMGKGARGDLRFGWHNKYGDGHTSGTLPNEVNVEMGGAGGNGQYGGIAAGAWDSDYEQYAYIPVPTTWASNLTGMPDTDGFTVGGDGDTTVTGSTTKTVEKTPTSWSEVAGIAASAFGKGMMGDLLNVLGIPDTPPALAAYGQWRDANAQDANEVDKGVGAGADTSTADALAENPEVKVVYDPAKGAEQWRPVVIDALKRVGGSRTDADRTVTQIDYESGGDPNATNGWDSNAANGDPSKGLLQVIGSTFQAFRDKELPNDRTDPLANIVAALNYVAKQYGGPSNIWPTRGGYASGGQVSGPGGRRADRIPAWLSDMEHVVNASDAIANRDLLGAINAGFPAQDVMSGLLDANRELSIAAAGGDSGYGSLSALIGNDHARLVAAMAADVGEVARTGGGQQTVVNNQFIAANPEEMHRLYRREAGKRSRGKVGAR